MRKSLISFGHSVHILAHRHSAALLFIGVYQLIGQQFTSRSAAFAANRLKNPAKSQRLLATRIDLHGNLVAGSADTLTANLEHRLDVIDSFLEYVNRLSVVNFLADYIHRVIENTLGSTLLAVPHQAIDELAGQQRPILRVGLHLLTAGGNASHKFTSQAYKRVNGGLAGVQQAVVV